jgi:hypothetical protein
MGDRCAPLRLPIHVETSCSTKESCGCNNPSGFNGTCDPNCEINSAVSFQGTFQNNCCKDLAETAGLAIASLSNVRKNECQPDLAVTLNPICLSWCDFLLLFYRANNTFSVLPNSYASCAVNFNGQTYQDTTNLNTRLNVTELITKAWANQCETSIAKLPAKTAILLNKESSYIKSLLSANSIIALTLDQVISTLLSNGEIEPADSTSSATAQFTIEYVYYFKPLNVAVQINFVYQTKIPCYKNVSYCDKWCPPYSYSKDYDCRSCDSLKTNNNVYDNLKHNFESESQNDDNNSQNDFESIGDLKDFKDLSKCEDDKTYMSMDSSKW